MSIENMKNERNITQQNCRMPKAAPPFPLFPHPPGVAILQFRFTFNANLKFKQNFMLVARKQANVTTRMTATNLQKYQFHNFLHKRLTWLPPIRPTMRRMRNAIRTHCVYATKGEHEADLKYVLLNIKLIYI